MDADDVALTDVVLFVIANVLAFLPLAQFAATAVGARRRGLSVFRWGLASFLWGAIMFGAWVYVLAYPVLEWWELLYGKHKSVGYAALMYAVLVSGAALAGCIVSAPVIVLVARHRPVAKVPKNVF